MGGKKAPYILPSEGDLTMPYVERMETGILLLLKHKLWTELVDYQNHMSTFSK